jgi:hypothetical protein
MSDEFEMEVELHAERMGKKFKQYREFIKNFKSRANPAMKNAVRSVKAIGKELKYKIKDTGSHKTEKLDYLRTIPKRDISRPDPFTTFQQFYPNASTIDSPSTSSSQSSTSEMNILQELEALPMFKATDNGSQRSVDSSSSSKPKAECNLIDLSDSIDSMQFDPLTNGERKNLPVSKRVNPWGSSELLREVDAVVDELRRKTSAVASTPSSWTKFE